MGQNTQELRREIESTRNDLGSTVDQIEDRVSPQRIVQRRKTQVKERVSSFSNMIMGTVEHAKDSAGDMKQSVQGTKGAVQENMHEAQSAAIDQTQGSPLLAGAVAAGIGFLASVAFPSSKAESQAAQQLTDKAQPLIEEAKQQGQEIAGELKEQGKQSAQELKSSATERAQTVKDNATDVAQDTKSQAKGKAKDLKNQVQ